LPELNQTIAVVAIFAAVYLGMIVGGLPFLQIDRTGIALLGAIAIVGLGVLSPEEAAQSIHLPTILLLFSFMVISAQMRLGGFYGWVTVSIAALPISPPTLLAAVILVVGVLSAVFSNDVVCLAVAPVLASVCVKRRLDPVPFLLALACAANIGSAATLIGNPQNMLIGAVLKLDFGRYFLVAVVPVLLGLVALWTLIAWRSRRKWTADPHVVRSDPQPAVPEPLDVDLNLWQTAKGLLVAAALVLVFLLTDWPREVAAITGAGLLLMSRRLHSTHMLGQVDWELLILFIGLFVVNHALEHTGITGQAIQWLAASGLALGEPAPLFATTFVLSNIVSNVPAVMLLLPAATEAFAGPMLALVSTLAGNLVIVGSIANLIVIDAARRSGIVIDWRRHARTGVPVTIVTLAISAAWLVWWRANVG
jgi:Na+/H+ antiporter NhaD/arsenite permease-like protein